MRVLQIQGLRALAAVIVTLFHARLLSGGFIGVDIFYVISGYLITGLIIRELDSTGSLNLNSFYQRRIKRLLPSSVFVLFSTAIVGWFVLPTITRDALGRDLFAASAYISNYLFAWWQNDYQNLNATPSPFIHYWSLAVEEQFYLIWPVLIIIFAKFGKDMLLRAISAITVLSLLLSIYQTQTSPIWAFYSLPTRAWELGTGALLLFIPKRAMGFRLLPFIGLLAIVYSMFHFNERTAFPGASALIPVLGTAILIGSISVWPPLLNTLANNSTSQWLGRISYPLYLWHWPVLVIPSIVLSRPLDLYERALCIVVTLFLAQVTHIWIEEPLRHASSSRRRIYLLALTTTCISLITSLAIAHSATSEISIKGTTSSVFDVKQVTAKPLIYGDGCHLNFGDIASGNCAYGDLNSTTTIVLYGDSHAAQWFPALDTLAKEHGFKLISLTKSSCPSIEVLRPDQGAYKNNDCSAWRERSITRIQAIHPTAVIVSGFEHYELPGGSSYRARWWSKGQKVLLEKLNSATNTLIYITDTPKPVQDIPSCLATHDASRCDDSVRSVSTVIAGFQVINPTTWLCSTSCSAIVDHIVAYRDASHISVQMSQHLAPMLGSALIRLGLFS